MTLAELEGAYQKARLVLEEFEHALNSGVPATAPAAGPIQV